MDFGGINAMMVVMMCVFLLGLFGSEGLDGRLFSNERIRSRCTVAGSHPVGCIPTIAALFDLGLPRLSRGWETDRRASVCDVSDFIERRQMMILILKRETCRRIPPRRLVRDRPARSSD